MARFCKDENGFYKYSIMSILYHYTECHHIDDDVLCNKRTKVANELVAEFLRDSSLRQKTFSSRTELNKIVDQMNALARQNPRIHNERYEIRGRTNAAGVRIRCK